MGRPPVGKTAMTGAERQRRYWLKRQADKPVTKPVAKLASAAADVAQIAALNKELARAKARIAELEIGRATAGADAEDDTATMRDEIIKLKTVLEAWGNVVESRESGIMKLATFKLIRSCLHPDSRHSASDEKLNRAFRIFNRLELVLCDDAEIPAKAPALTSKELAWLRGRKKRQKLTAQVKRRRPASPKTSKAISGG